VPDIECPETLPEYVMAAEPTVPKRILVPVTLPDRLSVSAGSESVMVPRRFDPVSYQLSVNVAEDAPLREAFGWTPPSGSPGARSPPASTGSRSRPDHRPRAAKRQCRA
jgi:hypothetical protein